ncbi:variable surface protein [Plasmodium gonderi]|uniref:Variable surface protein n=1 Tax=Plasmodium gonderi TaxID=77519 RepID=A0A1Y1JS22_PLAGO|nr:variable surface protein [Plasmodium gonderi]GAW84248.1 variable surface protein [Plasmodium gonderi]
MNSRSFNIYIHVNSFDNHNSRFQNVNSDTTRKNDWTNYCSSILQKYDKIFNQNFYSICLKVLYYLKQLKETNEELDKHLGCTYIYYWLYNERINNGYKYDCQILYDDLLKVYKDNVNEDPICYSYNAKISQDELEKFKDIYDMNKILNNLINENGKCSNINKCNCAKEGFDIYMRHKYTCESNINPDFCNALKNIRDRYNEQMKIEKCNEAQNEFLPIFETNNRTFSPSIPIFIILAMSIFLFNVYKFTPCESFIRRAIKRKRDIYNNSDEEHNLMQNYEMCNSVPRNKRYNVLYNSS